MVWDGLAATLAPLTNATVVDVGGGTGGFAVRVAELGHRVTVVDPNPDALAILDRRAEESGVADRVLGLQGDLAGLGDLVAPESVDVVLCHGLLELVDPVEALAAIRTVLREDGSLSLLVSQCHATVLARAMAGHFQQAQALLEPIGDVRDSRRDIPDSGMGRRFTAAEVTALLAGSGFADPVLHAVRVFVDLVPSALVDHEPGAAEALVALEQAVADRPEYLAIATQIHALARKAG